MFRLRSTIAILAATAACRGFAQQPLTLQAAQSDSFADSIGVNIHLSYNETPYHDFESIIKPALFKSGIRHVRDYAWTNQSYVTGSYSYYKDYQELAPKVHCCMYLDYNNNDWSKIAQLKTWTGGGLEAIEGPNEPDGNGDPNWAATCAALQQTLWNTVRNTPALQGVAVLGPSIVWNGQDWEGNSQYLTYGNFHPYPGGVPPLTSFAARQANALLASGGKPLWATETGYGTALEAAYNQPPVSELGQAKYTDRVFLDYFNNGVVKAFNYELIQETSAINTNMWDGFSLLRYNGSEKPAFTALSNLISLTSDKGYTFQPGQLELTLTGNNSKTHTTLLQKHDGSFWLAIWQDLSVFSAKTMKDVENSPVPITLTLPQEANVTVYVPRLSTQPQAAYKNKSSVTINSLDEVTLVEIQP